MLDLILSVTSETGVPIDPVFNVKSVKAMTTEMHLRPDRFKGSRVLYIHSGNKSILHLGDLYVALMVLQVASITCLVMKSRRQHSRDLPVRLLKQKMRLARN